MPPVRQVQIERHIRRRAVGSAGSERGVEDSKLLGDANGPCNHDVGDYI